MYKRQAAVCPFAFGGGWTDIPISFAVGCCVGYLQFYLASMSNLYSSVFEVTASIVVSFISRGIGSIKGGDIFCFSAIAQGSLALILPGYIILCGSLELQSRNLVAGSVRMFYAIIYSLFLGFGITLGAALYGWVDKNSVSVNTCAADHSLNDKWKILFVPLFALSLGLINQARWLQVPVMLIIASIGYIGNFFAGKHFSTVTEFTACIGAFIVGVLGNLYSRIWRGMAAVSYTHLDVYKRQLYDRVLYIFGCKNTAQCSKKKGSIKAFRGISKDAERIAQIKQEQDEAVQKDLDEKLQLDNKKKFNIELTKDLFSTDKSTTNSSKASNPFGSSTGSNPFASSTSQNPFAPKQSPFDANPFGKKEEPKKEEKPAKQSYAEIASKNIPKKKGKSNKSQYELPAYAGSFLYVDKETFKKEAADPELEKYKHLIDMDVNKEDGQGSGSRRDSTSSVSASGIDPNRAKISNMLDDKYFENFSNTVKHNPGQVLRYNLGGTPLLYSGRDDIAKKFLGCLLYTSRCV